MIRYIVFILATIVIAFSVSACSQSSDEEAFKRNAKEFRSLLSRIEDVPPKIISGPDVILRYYEEHGGTENIPKELKEILESDNERDKESAKGIIIVDYTPQVEFYKKTEGEWTNAAKNLEDFCAKYPASIWLDDARILLSYFVYADKADDTRNMHNVAKRNMGVVVKDHKQLHIEKWTLNKFDHEMVESLIQSKKDLLRPDMSVDELVYAVNKLAYGLMLVGDGEEEAGKVILDELSGQYRGLPIEDVIRSEFENRRHSEPRQAKYTRYE